MFLHIGGSRVVPVRDIVGIFNIAIKEKQCNKEFLQTAARMDDYFSKEEVKSFIVTTDKVGFSPIAPGTLQKRLDSRLFSK
ncbi:MAG: DUF370 domain-containing protein [Bacillota bacterium]|jgi:hypothetical protein|nr:DUF370 domain-containing protein [Bacillota bacterium]